MRRYALTLLILIIPILASCGSGSATAITLPYPTSFTTNPCPFKVGTGLKEGTDVICGQLTVPEDRSQPKGATVKLAVATFRTITKNAPNEPVIFLQGGPGGGIVSDLGSGINSQNRETLVGPRDLVLIDQRGTGLTQPSLACPEVTTLNTQLLSQVLPETQAVQQQGVALAQCHDRLVNQKINLNNYNTLMDANDIHDLIVTRNYPAATIYGVSYGTRVALEVMRSFPARVKNVVLDSVVPPDLTLVTAAANSHKRLFDQLFAGCAANATCSSRYPTLQQDFQNVVQNLEANPITLQVTNPNTNVDTAVALNGKSFEDTVWQLFYISSVIPQVPALIETVNRGIYDGLKVAISLTAFDNSVNYGTYFSVECAEDLPNVTPAAIQQADQVYNSLTRQDYITDDTAEITQCQQWNVNKAVASQRQPVVSSIPTLILEGTYDPITPPANGNEVARTLSNQVTLLFPASGHGVYIFSGNDCANIIVHSFFSVSTKVDTSCLKQQLPPQFL